MEIDSEKIAQVAKEIGEPTLDGYANWDAIEQAQRILYAICRLLDALECP